MAFAHVDPWIKHEMAAGRCLRCGAVIPTGHDGPLWVRTPPDLRALVEPMGRWKECA